jgi:tRNA(His) guanylyltransferase
VHCKLEIVAEEVKNGAASLPCADRSGFARRTSGDVIVGNLGDRMKRHEAASQLSLTPKIPLIVRVDGRAFHALTRYCKEPFDAQLIECIAQTAVVLCQKIDGAQLAYVQSDEISVLAVDYATLDSEPWFGGNVQKIVSVAASVATVAFNRWVQENGVHLPGWAMFDARVFVLPRDEVVHYFIWRQQDWIRNSLNMLARSHFSQQEVHRLTRSQLHDKLFTEKGVNWAHLPTHLKNGTCVYKVPHVVKASTGGETDVIRAAWTIDRETPVFTRDRAYIERHVNVDVQLGDLKRHAG